MKWNWVKCAFLRCGAKKMQGGKNTIEEKDMATEMYPAPSIRTPKAVSKPRYEFELKPGTAEIGAHRYQVQDE